jgi:hypothetical protein
VARSRDALNRSISGSFGTAALPEVDEGLNGGGGAGSDGRPRSATNSSTLGSIKEGGKDEDEDRVDARNAASRLAQSTF